jgi:hypothetical protein
LQHVARGCTKAVEEVCRDEDPPLITLKDHLCAAAYSLASGGVAAENLQDRAPAHIAPDYVDLETDSGSAGWRSAAGKERRQIRFHLAVYVRGRPATAMAIRDREGIHVRVVKNTFAHVGNIPTLALHHLANDVNARLIAVTGHRQVRNVGLKWLGFIGCSAQKAGPASANSGGRSAAGDNRVGNAVGLHLSWIVHSPDLQRGLKRRSPLL